MEEIMLFGKEVEEMVKSLKRSCHFCLTLDQVEWRERDFQAEGKTLAKARGIGIQEVTCGDWSIVGVRAR